MFNHSVVIFDNGAHTIKCGLSNNDEEPRMVPNSVVRLKHERNKQFVGSEFNESLDYSIVHYRLPFERIDPREHNFLVTEPPFNMHTIQETYDQMIFEEWEFRSYYRCPSAILCPYGDIFNPGPQPECAIIVDSGFSFTHVIPVTNDNSGLPASIQWPSVRRLDVGGKLLTNHLKELVSFRHWDMTESTYIINQVKESCCFVSKNWSQDLEICRAKINPTTRSYVLPNFGTEPPKPGYITTLPQEGDTILPMNNERFSIPEILFSPSHVGLSQTGLPGIIAHSINSLPEDQRGVAWGNIGLVGGNTLFDGFEQRLFEELRTLAPDEYEICLYRARNPLTSSFHSARTLARSPIFPSLCVTREEYLEGGANACRRRFAPVNWLATKEKDVGGTRKEQESGARKETAGRGRGRRRKTVTTSEEVAPAFEAMDVDPKS
ncbi:actin family [Rhizoctonia solani]|uniref:Actin-like protein ARP6 n=1 Tax=Rhizoctonia solani TaxID=456999 RepID=A0A8H7H1Y4_9AGAM|nr:actin family [Rhizoctonia solani]KAF8751079.1 actin family [Rhizoctonia solani]